MQNYITYECLIKLLCKSRKSIVKDICKLLNINIYNHHFSCIENDTLDNIIKVFDTELIYKQYKINNYFVDLYFPVYKIAVECDELDHEDRDEKYEREREEYIKELGITFILFTPITLNNS